MTPAPWFSAVASFYSLPPTVSCNGISPLVTTTRGRQGSPKEHRAQQRWPRKTHSVTFALGLLHMHHAYVRAMHHSSVAQLRSPSHHPSCLTSVSLGSLSFSQYFTHFMPLLSTMPLVQLLLHIDTSWPLSPILYCSANFSVLPKLYTPHSFCVPHPFHILHQLLLATQVLNTIHYF